MARTLSARLSIGAYEDGTFHAPGRSQSKAYRHNAVGEQAEVNWRPGERAGCGHSLTVACCYREMMSDVEQLAPALADDVLRLSAVRLIAMQATVSQVA